MKLRTKSAITKRFKANKKGTVTYKTVGDAKLHAHKARKTKRRYGKTATLIQPTMKNKIKKALGV